MSENVTMYRNLTYSLSTQEPKHPTVFVTPIYLWSHPACCQAYQRLYEGSGMKSCHKRFMNIHQAVCIALAFKEWNRATVQDPIQLNRFNADDIHGFAMITKKPDQTYWVNEVISSPEKRGEGYGASVLHQLIIAGRTMDIPHLYLECSPEKEGNHRPLPEYYAKFGFKVVEK